MKIGMIGLPQVGKKTLFELLTGHRPSENEIASSKPIKSMAEIKDPRFDWLVDLYNPKKQVRARIDIELLPKLEKDTIAKGDIFNDIADADALLHVVRAFEDDSVYHIDGSVDPKRDIEKINSELILYDLIFTEKRLERIDKKAKVTKDEASIKEKELLEKIKAHLDKELPLRLISFTQEENKFLTTYPFVTRKDMLIVLNVAEGGLSGNALVEKLSAAFAPLKIGIMQVSAKVESEIAKLESEAERKEFMQSLGIAEPAINILTRLLLKSLNLISFFTVGQDEVRQWLIRALSHAPDAAGAIHSDLQKGFIRAEVMKYNELKDAGEENKLKAAGKVYLKGKDYVVEDGDILNIRFSV